MIEPTSILESKMGKIDVSFGLPLYMQEYWDFIQKMYSRNTDIKINQEMPYSFAIPNSKLSDLIKDLHNKTGNAKTSGYTVVVGAGASQVISALGYAIGKMPDTSTILLKPPYWGRLKFLLTSGHRASGRFVYSDSPIVHSGTSGIEFITSPNNPDGKVYQKGTGDLTVMDMCYNWPQYTDKVTKGDADVMIFGLSKATGHAGTRIGWALVKNDEIARLMTEYMELSTCGVSVDAQARAIGVISTTLWLQKSSIPSCFDFGRDKLMKRWSAFNRALSGLSDIKCENNRGMFAWCRTTTNVQGVPYMQEKYGITVSPGENMGLDSGTFYFRINIGCSDEDFAKMIGALDGSKTAEA